MIISPKGLPTIVKKRVQSILPWIVIAIILIVSVWLRARYLMVQGWTHDEAIGLLFAVLVNAGNPAYSVTFVGFPPLALLTIQLGSILFGTNLAVRYPMMLFSLVGVAAIFSLSRPQKSMLGLFTGLLTAVFLSFNPSYFHASSSLELEVPAIAMAILSLALAQRYYASRKVYWLVLSGIAFTFSLTLKSLLVFFPALIGLLILVTAWNSDDKTWTGLVRQLVIGGAAWFFGVVIPLLVFLIIYDPWAMYQQVLAFRFAVREASILRGNITLLDNAFGVSQTLLTEYGFLFIGAITGFFLGWRRHRSYIWPWCAWLVLAVALLMWHIPFRSRYSLIVLPPLVVLSGLAAAYLFTWLFQKLRSKESGWLGTIVVSLLVMGTIAWIMAVPVKSAFLPPSSSSSDYVFSYLTNELRDAIDYARDNTVPGDCIVTDDPRFAIAAGRLPPPALSLTSDARLMTKWMMDTDRLVSEVDSYDCPMVVYYFRRFRSHLPDLSEKLQDRYFLRIAYTNEIVIFTAKKNVSQQPHTSLDVQLGEAISLRGIDLTPNPWHPGQRVQLATYWTALKPPDQAYKVFLQLKNDQNETIATFDHFPFPVPGYRYKFTPDIGGQYEILPNIDEAAYSIDIIATYPERGMVPTNAWPVGNTIREVTSMNLPASLPVGTYHLYIGMYERDTMLQLPVYGGEAGSNEFLLTSVLIVEADDLSQTP